MGKVTITGQSTLNSSSVAMESLEWTSGTIVLVSDVQIGDFIAQSGSDREIKSASDVTATISGSFTLSSRITATKVQFSLTGSATVSTGALLNGAVESSGNFNVANGTITFPNNFTLNGGILSVASGAEARLQKFVWNSGTMRGPGLVSLYNSPSISNSSQVAFGSDSKVSNNGDLKWNLPSSFDNVPFTLATLSNKAEITFSGSASSLPVALDNQGRITAQVSLTIRSLANSGAIFAAANLTVGRITSCSRRMDVGGSLIFSSTDSYRSELCEIYAKELIVDGILTSKGQSSVTVLYLQFIIFTLYFLLLC